MGWLSDILAFPVMGPVKGIAWIAGKVAEQADRELFDEEGLRGRLMELELRYDLGEIEEAEYLQLEEELLARLREVRERQTAGGE